MNDLLQQPRLPGAPFTDLTPLLQAGQQMIKRRSLLFVISDFISAPGWERPLNLLTQRHEVMAVRLFDRREVELPDVGPLLMEDAETGEQMYVDTHDKAFRRRFLEASERREATLRDAFRRSGVDAVSLSTDEDLVAGDRPHGHAPAPAAAEVGVSFLWPTDAAAARDDPARRAPVSEERGSAAAADGRRLGSLRVGPGHVATLGLGSASVGGSRPSSCWRA